MATVTDSSSSTSTSLVTSTTPQTKKKTDFFDNSIVKYIMDHEDTMVSKVARFVIGAAVKIYYNHMFLFRLPCIPACCFYTLNRGLDFLAEKISDLFDPTSLETKIQGVLNDGAEQLLKRFFDDTSMPKRALEVSYLFTGVVESDKILRTFLITCFLRTSIIIAISLMFGYGFIYSCILILLHTIFYTLVFVFNTIMLHKTEATAKEIEELKDTSPSALQMLKRWYDEHETSKEARRDSQTSPDTQTGGSSVKIVDTDGNLIQQQ